MPASFLAGHCCCFAYYAGFKVNWSCTACQLHSGFFVLFFVLYASFLTRSGILGDTSVHSFVVSGLENHLLLYLFVFTFISCWLIIRHWKKILQRRRKKQLLPENSGCSSDLWCCYSQHCMSSSLPVFPLSITCSPGSTGSLELLSRQISRHR